MAYKVNRLGSLRVINILYLVVLLGIISLPRIYIDETLYFYIAITIGSILLLGVLFVISFLGWFKENYQNSLYIVLWINTLFGSIVFLRSNDIHLISLVIILLLITVYSIFNKTVKERFIGIYLTATLPFLFIAEIDNKSKVGMLFAILTILLLSYMKSVHDYSMYKAYEKSHLSQNLLLANSKEGFACFEVIEEDNGKIIDYKFLSANEAFESMTDLDQSEIIGKSILEVMPGIEEYWIEAYGNVVINSTSCHFINYSKTLRKYFDVYAYPIGNKQFATLFTDISEQVTSERKLKHALQRLEKVDHLKNQFLRDVNHRLRTPLNGMMGMMQLIEVDEIGEENKGLFEAMAMEMRHSRNIIDQISKYADIQGMKYEFTKRNILSLIEGVVERFSGIEIAVTILEHNCEDDELYVEKDVLISVLTELIRNGINHTKNNRVHIELECDVKEQDQTYYFNIKVKDYGDGLDAEKIQLIFNEFYHHDFINIYKDDNHISLPMCKQMMILSGGDLLVESVVGQETTFTMVVPVYTA